MAYYKVGDPVTNNYIKPNADGSINTNVGSNLNVNIGSVTAEVDVGAFKDANGVKADAQVAIAGSTWFNGSFIPILAQVAANDASHTSGTARELYLTTTGRLKADSSVGSIGTVGITNRDTAIGSTGIPISVRARSSQAGSVDNDDTATLVSDLYGQLVLSNYTWSTNSNRVEEIDPLSQQYVEEELVDSTNVGSGTWYYPGSTGMAMGGYKDFCVHGMIGGGVTATIEATCGSDPADFLDISKAGYELTTNTTGNGSFEDTNFIWDFENLNVQRVRVVINNSDATNNVQLNVRRKAL